MIWDEITALASAVSMIAFVLTALYVRGELKAIEKDRYVNITNQMFAIWQTESFMEAQLWLLHRLEETTWEGFVAAHRADRGEMAFHRVGSFYDRLGTMVRLKLVDDREILSTVGPYAIAVWQKIAPLVREARRIENSVLFDDFENLLPACHECYVPTLGKGAQVTPFSLAQPGDRITKDELRQRLEQGEVTSLVDVRNSVQIEREPETLPGAVRIAPDEVERRYAELPRDREAVIYCS